MLSEGAPNQRFAIEMAYDGGPYHGWQIQPNAVTVQEVLEQGLSLILREPITVVGAGRTDTGVHASHFVAHFDAQMDALDTEQLCYKLNSFVKDAIRIDRIVAVSSDFHSRFSAVRRTYHYLTHLDKEPFFNQYSWGLHRNPDVEAMNLAAQFLVGESDFTSFARNHADLHSHICRVDHAAWSLEGRFLFFNISANRFLRNMVRAIVGTLMDIGWGKYPPEHIQEVMNQKDRSSAGQSAPPQGLFLTRIEYPPNLFRIQPKPPFPFLF